MLFSDRKLSERLEQAEGYACAQFAAARRRLIPNCNAEFMNSDGAFVVFDTVDSPVTQTFGLGLFQELNESSLAEVEEFFRLRGAPVYHEISPFVGTAAIKLLCSQGYFPIEISNVLYRSIDLDSTEFSPTDSHSGVPSNNITVRRVSQTESDIWTEVNARGWSHEQPELYDFALDVGKILCVRENSYCFLAELDGKPAAAGTLSIHDGVALFSGATTVPEMRRKGLQNALLMARMRFAAKQQCELAMIVADIGSTSQKNAERNGFRVAYTRTKWKRVLV